LIFEIVVFKRSTNQESELRDQSELMPLISRSIGRKIFATVLLSVGLVFVYETTIRDSRYAARRAMLSDRTGTPLPGTRLLFQATAYCKGTTTASGVNVRTGIAAADPDLLPVGSVISVNTGDAKYSGIYTIMDTGPAVQGRTLDVYMWSCHEALAFGRKQVQVTVLRLGWNPRASTPGIVDALFRSRQVKKDVAGTAGTSSGITAQSAQDAETVPTGAAPTPPAAEHSEPGNSAIDPVGSAPGAADSETPASPSESIASNGLRRPPEK
jgi:3D (Asp-Asp-Asp) domain-containing protein